MEYIGLILVALSGVSAKSFIKAFQKNMSDEKIRDSSYFILTIIVACSFFAILSGFDLRLNKITAICAAILAVFVFLVNSTNLKAFSVADMLSVSIASSGGSIVIPSLFGMLFLNEPVSIKIILGIVCSILALLVPYFWGDRTKRISPQGFFYCLLLFSINGLCGVYNKIYTMLDGINSNSVYCFYANVFLIPFVLYRFFKTTSLKEFSAGLKTVRKTVFLYPVFTCISANFNTYIAIYVVANMNITVYSVLSFSLATIFTVIVSRFVFKEIFTKEKLLSAGLAIASCILMVA